MIFLIFFCVKHLAFCCGYYYCYHDFLVLTEASGIPPVIKNDQTEFTVYVGQNFSVECKLLKPEKLDRVVYFGWFRYFGYNETEDGLPRVHRGPMLASKAEFTINNVTHEDGGQYVCIVADQLKTDWKVFNVTVKDPETGKINRTQSRIC